MDNQSNSSASRYPRSADELQITDDWQVLSPVAILYFTASIFRHLFGNIIYLIPALAVSYKSVLEHPYIWLPGILMAFLLLMLFAFVSFKVYRYRLTEGNIEIRSGIFSKKHLNLPFSRVQNVKIEQPIYYRFTGHACLQLDTAGSAKSEAKLIALKLDFAQKLKTLIQNQVPYNTVDTHQSNILANSAELRVCAADKLQQQERVLNQRKLSDLVIHGFWVA
jgi:putative membrane protein